MVKSDAVWKGLNVRSLVASMRHAFTADSSSSVKGSLSIPDKNERKRRVVGHTCFDHSTPMVDVEVRCDERDIGKIENLCSMRESDGP